MTTPPNVMMLTQFLGLGGLERMILSLCRELRKSSAANPAVFVYDHPKASGYRTLLQDFLGDGFPVNTTSKPPGFSFLVAWKIAEQIRRQKISVIHTHHIGCLMYALLARLLSLRWPRIIVTQHSFIHLSAKKRYSLYERFITPAADAVTAVSENIAEQYTSLGLKRSAIHLIENGVEFVKGPVSTIEERNSFRSSLNTLEETVGKRDRLAAHKEHFWILYMARIYPQKGQDRALEIWSRMLPEFRQRASLLIIGPTGCEDYGGKIDAMIAAAPDAGNIIRLGATINPLRWICSSDLFLSCSSVEGLPLGPLEAAGSGLPCLLSDIPGHQILKGKATFFPLEDPAEGARKIQETISKHAASFEESRAGAIQASEEIRSRFSLESMTNKYAALYQQLSHW